MMTTDGTVRRRCYYSDYLRLDSLLAQQVRESERMGAPAHEIEHAVEAIGRVLA